MNHINVSVSISHPAQETQERLETFLRHYAPEAEMTFTLRAPFDIAALNVGLTLHRDVTARVVPLGLEGRAYAITWSPTLAGPFPAFNGTIYINEDESDPKRSFLTLDGHYRAPMGVAGEMFDAVLGKHIAQASAENVVERITQFIDRRVVPVSSTVTKPAFA